MEELIEIENKKYFVCYNESAIKQILDDLDIVKPVSRPIVEQAIIYYACFPRQLKSVYIAVAKRINLSPNTVAVHIRNALITAEFNGGLKNIDDLIGAEIYDYDYGLSSKNFLAVISSHLKQNRLLRAKIVDN